MITPGKHWKGPQKRLINERRFGKQGKAKFIVMREIKKFSQNILIIKWGWQQIRMHAIGISRLNNPSISSS